MSSVDSEERTESRPRRGGGMRFRPRRKVCYFCANSDQVISYKDIDTLRNYLEGSKIRGRRKSGACAKHQRRIALAIKRARHLALLPFVGDISRS